jgi:hypothetical protein
MTTNSSNDRGCRTSHPAFTGCQSLDALRKEMFQSPRLLELERTIRRHPDYPLLRLKEQLARRPAYMLGAGEVSLESVDSFRDEAGGVGFTYRVGSAERAMALDGTTESRWSGEGVGRKTAAVVCHRRSAGIAFSQASSPSVELPATVAKSSVVVEDCEELMLLLAKRNSEVPKMSARVIERLMLDEFEKEIGKENCFTYRTIQDTILYKMWRKALKIARHNVGLDDLGDALETGLEISTQKHGRSNRRKDYSQKDEAAIRGWKKDVQNAAAEASHRVQDKKKSR